MSDRTAAKRLGMPVVRYTALRAVSKWCWRCKDWHPRENFGPDGDRSDGLKQTCRKANAALEHARRENRRAGRRFRIHATMGA